ncbi:MAG: hypothetical protein JWP01_555 [Myxococcales bacterium]|nr:hypothetical protein [Myxococcales bacterium]
MRRLVLGLSIGVLLATGCEKNTAPTASDLPDLVARYETFINKVAEVVRTGDCAEKGSKLAPLFVMHAETDAKMKAAMEDPALKDELQRLIDERDEKISDAEIAFINVKRECAGQPGFPAPNP